MPYAAVAIGTGPAFAADLLPPPIEAPYLPGGDFSGWSLRGDVGVGSTQLNDMHSTSRRALSYQAFRATVPSLMTLSSLVPAPAISGIAG